jgi:hypothetical protein
MKIPFTLFIILLSGIVFAQQNPALPIKQNSISIHSGHIQFKDENLHTKVFRGLSVGAYYSHSNTGKKISEYSTGLNMSLLNTMYEDFPSAVGVLIKLNYKYLFSVVSKENFMYYLGMVSDLQYGSNAYFNWDESHFYYANYIGLGIGNRLSYIMNKRSFDLDLDIPLVALISRPLPDRQYKIDNVTFSGIMKNLASNPEFALPDKNFLVRTNFAMNFFTKKMKTRVVGYNLKYHFMQAAKGKPYQNIENSISFKLVF